MSEMKSIFEKIEVLKNLNEEIKRNINLLYVFRDSKNKINVILVTKEDQMYCFGGNDFGVLGFGHDNSIKEFTINKDLSNKSIVYLQHSFNHIIARDSDGKLYCWGRNICLGNGTNEDRISKPELSEYLAENIIDMHCGEKHTLVLTSNNEVYAWGYNDKGQIGNGSDDINVLIPFKLNEFNKEKVECISCGPYFSMALTESGCVYSWGNNECGQLGVNTNVNQKKPKCIQIEVKFKKISCGYKHSLVLSLEGDIYVFGWNKYKQLGTVTEGETQLTPKKLNHSEKFIDIASHFRYNISAALSENKLYYVWGKCGRDLVISEPKETSFKSFDELFAYYLTITYKTYIIKFSNSRYHSEFKELEIIASGNYGIVCKAIEIRNGKIFAIKKVAINEQFIVEDLKEINILSNLNSERIVKYDSHWIENNYYDKTDELKEKLRPSHKIFKPNNTLLLHIQMELCYKTLKEIIKIVNKELNQKESEVMTPLGYFISSEIFVEILESVDYLHKQNIIHRDLKPTNILITDGTKGRFVKVGDFGLATIHEPKGQSHTKYSGTPLYRAPEVSQTKRYDRKADIYSLGIIASKLFNIDINEPIGEKSCLETEYSKLFELIIKMSSLQKNKRPDCEEIQREKSSWGLSLPQLKKSIDLKISDRTNTIEKSFHIFFIQTKLNL